ncbi:putative amine transporter [Aspergillus fischeri NRRL 181]|uniref:MFS transporter, putative n=1 Tax=Neosartorya fischeri (strain ATCC 1020 / DSM 3700 / CBS 544.65 / FGSC A1164 / JCM 1740 / NRRL 181 / WB 181) TaxID=331117 RepID=A1D5M4_NEOFI|nr:MFS transporter, putative [Aspergillus fischeri NRRL 181]EAW21018.1 MFS transporter, putative [Aspergillus fischeri NRRL 181]
MTDNLHWGCQWRSSKAFTISTIIVALFAETFLYGFIVPILSFMVDVRLRLPPSHTQRLTTALLTVHGFVSIASAPVIAHFTDKSPNCKVPLLISLAGCMIGTFLVASATTVWTLFMGRIMQACSGSATWIIGFATLADNVGQEHMGKVLGLAMSFVTAGTTLGPVVSGALLQLAGYWTAWSAPLVLLALDSMARMLMLEKENADEEPTTSDEERASLLASTRPEFEMPDQPSHVSIIRLYGVLLSDARIITGLLNTFAFSVILSGFDATLPLHLQDVFGWNSLPIGMIFLGIQIPAMLLGPLVGWLRDCIGIRYPTALGWLLIAPLLWTIGVPGVPGHPWAGSEGYGEAIFIGGIVGIGAASPLVRGAGMFQLTAVTHDLQSENPSLFGSYGGNSRIFSILEIAFNTGAMIGPLFCGSLSEAIGFYYMLCILGMSLKTRTVGTC